MTDARHGSAGFSVQSGGVVDAEREGWSRDLDLMGGRKRQYYLVPKQSLVALQEHSNMYCTTGF